MTTEVTFGYAVVEAMVDRSKLLEAIEVLLEVDEAYATEDVVALVIVFGCLDSGK